jgi:Fungal specific transcription factor domain
MISGPSQPVSASSMSFANESKFLGTLSMTLQSIPAALDITSSSRPLSGEETAAYRLSPESMLQDPPLSSKSDQALFTGSTASTDVYNEQAFGQLAGSLAPSEPMSYISSFQSRQQSRSYDTTTTGFVHGRGGEVWSGQDYNEQRPSPSRSEDSDAGRVQEPPRSYCQVSLDPAYLIPSWSKSGQNSEASAQAGENQDVDHQTSKFEMPHALSVGGSFDQKALLQSPFPGIHTIGKTPRMQYLINYYSEVISPVIVAFDGPTNPYRSYILRLASGSETLQHAISALSASNLRQRRESGELSTGKTDPARRSSMAHLTLTDKNWQSVPGFLSVEDQRKEENYHKNATVQLIQRQFADPSQHRDDSVLATLLIVCLFHICESGVAKFRTHFAGAKKLLGMRDNGSLLKSKEAKWFTRMFTWFDAMTATVNDREGQMQDGPLDLSSLVDEDWTLENLAGCDGKLFKIIAKLSRLNILSQKGVLNSAPVTASCSVPLVIPNISYWNTCDTNGWNMSDSSGSVPISTEMYPDIQTQYGREWYDTRSALLSWTLDTSPFDSGSPDVPALSQEQQLDLLNISESFRFSALIYMERLALPYLASSDLRIQTWVQKALYHIKLVRSDVYLLWPLFVTGSECVSEDDRQVIRQRCLDIQKDSGFSNNASCLKLLEKIWISNTGAAGNLDQPSGFKWRSVMDSGMAGGEYIVV